MDHEHRTQCPNQMQCPYCQGELEHVERHDWMMSLCPACGGLWMEGNNLAPIIQHLHLTHLDSAQAFSELGTILQRGRESRSR